MENLYILTTDEGYGQYVYLIKANSVEEAKEKFTDSIIYDDYISIDSVAPLSEIVNTESYLIRLGGYVE